MLANGRPAMVRRAIRSFLAQTYEPCVLLVYDTSPSPLTTASEFYAPGRIFHLHKPDDAGKTIGTLRNLANASCSPDIFAHWDSDDWSHPNRLAEQVQLLKAGQASDVQVIGYRDMLFWRDTPDVIEEDFLDGSARRIPGGEAWLYRHVLRSFCIGTSLCYWRSAWQQKPFPDLPKPGINAAGEDDLWHKAFHSLGERSAELDAAGEVIFEPRMIASIHGGNSSYYGRDLLEHSPNWKRVPAWDTHCGKVMAL